MAAKKSTRKKAAASKRPSKSQVARMTRMAKSIATVYRQLDAASNLAMNVPGGSAQLLTHLRSAQRSIGEADTALLRLQAKVEG